MPELVPMPMLVPVPVLVLVLMLVPVPVLVRARAVLGQNTFCRSSDVFFRFGPELRPNQCFVKECIGETMHPQTQFWGARARAHACARARARAHARAMLVLMPVLCLGKILLRISVFV